MAILRQRRPAAFWAALLLGLLGVAAVGDDVTLSPDQLYQLVSIGGATAVLALIVVAFMKGWVVTSASADQRVKSAEDACRAALDEARRQQNEYRDMVLRSSGSQQVQVSAVRDMADAIVAAIVARQQTPP